MNHPSLITQLKRIPHLRLPLRFDADAMWAEVRDLDLVGYELPEGSPEERREQYRRDWRGLGLVDFTEDSRLGMSDARAFRGKDGAVSMAYDENGIPLTMETDLAARCPILMEAVYRVTDNPDRTRISCLVPGGKINWHSHCRFYSGNYKSIEYTTGIVHIPIRTNSECSFGVRRWPRQVHGLGDIKYQSYGQGECWMLNSWHEHAAHNAGDTTRYHLMIYAPIEGKFAEMLDQAVSYHMTGPDPVLLPEV